GQLSNPANQPITIDGLWGLTFGKAGDDDTNTLFFAAGINDEADGLFGTLQPVDTDAPARSTARSRGRAEIAGEPVPVVALLLPRVKTPNLAVQSLIGAPADSTTGEQTALSPAPRLIDVLSVRIVSRKVLDQAFGDFQPNLCDDVLANDLANALAN